MTEQDNLDGNWMNEITTKTETLKIKDGESVVFTFVNDGIKRESPDYGTSVAFLVKRESSEEDETFYVKSNNYDLLGQIREIAKTNNDSLKGLKVQASRTGSKRSDTRYKIRKV